MFVSLQFHDARDKATADSIIANVLPDLRALFHYKRGEGYRLSAKMDYKAYAGLLEVVNTVNAQLPPSIQPFEVITQNLDMRY